MGQQKIIGRFEPIGKEVGPARKPFDVLTKEDWVDPQSGRPGFKGEGVGACVFEYSVISEFWNWVPAGYAPAIPADGGPAFGELKQVGDRAIKQGGLTIRDYFAIHASADEVAALQKRKHAERADDMPLNDFEARYLYADQMLKGRAK